MGFMTVAGNPDMSVVKPGTCIALVLDCPTEEDFKQGRPINGTYGSVLSQALSIAKLTTSSLSIVFVFPDQKSSIEFWNEKTGFSVSGTQYVQRLKLQLEELAPNVIVPMGECALQALTWHKGITKWRGSMIPSTLVSRVMSTQTGDVASSLIQVSGLTSGAKLVPTICPKVAVRMYLFRYYIINDLKRALEESMYPEIRIPKRNLITQPDFLTCKNFLEDLIENKRAAGVDIEVHKGEVSCISFSPVSSVSISIPFDDSWSFDKELTLWILVARYLEDPTIPKKLQNSMFDRSFLMFRNRIITRGYIHDTMIKHNLNYPDFPKGLGFLCSIYTREPYYKDDGKTWFDDLKAGKGDIKQFYEYNARDSAVLNDMDDELTADLSKYGNTGTYEFNRRLMEPLLYMMMRGIKVDGPKLAEHRKEAASIRDDYQFQLDAMTRANENWKKPLNVASPKQCKDYFFSTSGLNLRPMTVTVKNKQGERVTRVSTSNKVMKKLAAKGVQEAKLVQSVRAYRKLIGTYLDVNYDKDGRLRCSFNIAGTNTGRLSSSETIFGTGTNMQNLPKVFKEFLVADDGCLMCDIDKAQAEWVVVAYLCGDANMIRTVENREDAHINTAHLMFGAPKELIKLEDDLLGSLSDEDKIRQIRESSCPEILKYHPTTNMSLRQAGKKSNHGLNYDLGDNGFAQTYGFPIEEAKRCRRLYHAAYPAIKVWHAHVRNQLANGRTLTNLFGRKRRFLDRWCDNLFKAAYAYVPQSTVAQLLNWGLIVLYEQQRGYTLGFLRHWDLLLQVHDSMLFQYRVDDLWGMAQTIAYAKSALEIPLVANGREFVIRTDAKIGYDAKNLEKINIEGTPQEIWASLRVTKEKLDEKRAAKLAKELEEKQLDELTPDDDPDYDEAADKNSKDIATPEETVYAGIDYF